MGLHGSAKIAQFATQFHEISCHAADETTTKWSDPALEWKSIVDAMRQPLLVLDKRQSVLFANRAFYRRFDVTPLQTVGHNLAAAGNRCLDAPALAAFVTLIANGNAIVEDHEIEIVVPELGTHVLLLSATRLSESDGSTVVSIDDITERRHREAESRSARWRAERSRIRQSRFLAAAGHELRQPLQSLVLTRAVLARQLEQGQTEEALRLIGQLNETGDTMVEVLDALLDINQLEEGTIHPEKRMFAINEVLDKLGAEFVHHAQARGLLWKMVRCEQSVWSDPHLLEQILRNLLSNAIKYTPAGKVLLGCRRRGDRLRIEVWDSGIGIAQARIPTIFREFEHHSGSSGSSTRESGLGLAIVRRLCDLLGHIVYLHSWPNSGSVFALELPMAQHISKSAIVHAREAGVKNLSRDATILIVEADAVARNMLDRLFAGEGYHTLAAANGEQARGIALGPVPPDIVIAGDGVSHDQEGLQLIAQVREFVGRQTPAVVLTGHISLDTKRQIAMQDCVQRTKPIHTNDLLVLVESLLTAARSPTPRKMQPNPRRGTQEPIPTIFVVDDDSSVRSAMRELLTVEKGWSVETYASAEAFISDVSSPRHGVLLVDAQMPGLDGIDLLERLHGEENPLPAIMISGHGDIRLAVRAMKAGAVAFLEKPVEYGEVMAVIEQSLERSRNAATRALWHEAAVNRLAGLTQRERQVLELVLEGKANKIIAYTLGISQRTVETHRATVMKKTGARSLSELVHLTIAGSAPDPAC